EHAERWAEAFAASVEDFVANNAPGRGIQWACPMEAALRGLNLAWAHALLRGARALDRPDFAVAFAALVVSSARFALENLEDSVAVPNNHLASDWLGLLACSLALPEWPEATRWRTLAIEGLRRE